MKNVINKGKRIFLGEDQKEYELEYYLIETKGEKLPIYGIQVIKYATNDSIKEVLEKNEVEGISYSKEIVTQMIKVLMDNQVTPMCLNEIIDDIVTYDSLQTG